MGKIRCKADGLHLAGRDEVVEVPDADVYAYTASANWDPADKAATTAHTAGERAEAEAVKARAVCSRSRNPRPSMSEGLVQIKGLDEFKRLAVVLKSEGNPLTGDVKKSLLAELRAAGKPVTASIRAAWASEMPHRGGLANRLAGARVATRTRLTGRSAGTSIVAQVPGWDLDAIEGGTVRHPVFRHRSTWVSQSVPAEVAGKAFLAMYPEMERAVDAAIDKVIAEVETKA
jgi:hypothetical protein